MNSPAEILMGRNRLMANVNARGRRFEVQLSDEEESAVLNGLERLVETFQKDEIPPKRFVKVTLEDPNVLLLAQQQSFRICRRAFFCPIQDCRLHKLIPSLGSLAAHIKTFHGAMKEETSDMV
jgi:hypothetical protein